MKTNIYSRFKNNSVRLSERTLLSTQVGATETLYIHANRGVREPRTPECPSRAVWFSRHAVL